MASNTEIIEKPVVFYDGICNLCNGVINFIIKRDSKGKLAFASLQSEYARARLESSIIDNSNPESVIIIVNGKLYEKSDAVIEIALCLGGIWPALKFFKIIPKGIRDGIYSWIARNRYHWFGKRDTCKIPSRSIQERFLDW